MITMLYDKMLRRKIVGAQHHHSVPNGHQEDAVLSPGEDLDKPSENVHTKIYNLFKRGSKDAPSKTFKTKDQLKESASTGKILNLMR